jgi:ABC-type multidrug transport system fused ATPase/permease subunit
LSGVKWLWRYFKEVKLGIVLMMLVFAAISLTELGTIYIQKKLIDDVFVPGDFAKLAETLLWLGFVCLANVCFHALGGFAYTRPYRKIAAKMSDDLFYKLQHIPVQTFQRERTSTYVRHITEDIASISEFAARVLPQFIANVAVMIVLVTAIGSSSLSLIAIILVVSVSYSLLMKLYHPGMQRISKEVQDRKDDVLVVMEEGLSSTREVLANHRMSWEERRYAARFSRYYAKVMEQGKLVNRQLFASEPLRWGGQLLVIGAGGYLVMHNEITLGTFIVIFSLTQRCMDLCQALFEQFMRLSENMGNVERVRRMMQQPSESEGVQSLARLRSGISFEEVDFAYQSDSNPLQVLRKLTLRIPAGKKIAFVGTSGGGKSTIAGMLIRFYEPTSGSIKVDGTPLEAIKRDDWTSRVDIVFQEPYLFPGSIRLNLTLGHSHVEERRLDEVCRGMQLSDVLDKLPSGYETEIGERGMLLSGGQRQRLALARAVLHNPDVLILDEATSALDMETEREVQRSLAELRRGKTTIVIAHRLSTVVDADLIFVMDKGTVAEQGTHEELLRKQGLYKRMVESQLHAVAAGAGSV